MSRMRILNMADANKDYPLAETGDLVYSRKTMGAAEQSARISAQKQAQMVKQAQIRAAQATKARADQVAMERAAYNHAQMLKQSLSRQNHKDELYLQAIREGHKPMQKSSMVKDGLMGWHPGETVTNMGYVDFSISDVVPAQAFDNILRQEHINQSGYPTDYPIVDDAKSDFGGVLLSESGSPDFSTMIVNDAPGDFGRISNTERVARLRRK